MHPHRIGLCFYHQTFRFVFPIVSDQGRTYLLFEFHCDIVQLLHLIFSRFLFLFYAWLMRRHLCFKSLCLRIPLYFDYGLAETGASWPSIVQNRDLWFSPSASQEIIPTTGITYFQRFNLSVSISFHCSKVKTKLPRQRKKKCNPLHNLQHLMTRLVAPYECAAWLWPLHLRCRIHLLYPNLLCNAKYSLNCRRFVQLKTCY